MIQDIEPLGLNSADMPLEQQRQIVSGRLLTLIAVGLLGLAWLAAGTQGAMIAFWAEVAIGLSAALQ